MQAGGLISIHALREEGDELSADYQGEWENFYPRPPRGGRLVSCCTRRGVMSFLSTPSARRATSSSTSFSKHSAISIHALREEGDLDDDVARLGVGISIHALREEGDRPRGWTPPPPPDFYPRPPRGGRRASASVSSSSPSHFYPRPPRGGRPPTLRTVKILSNFYPRPPRGGRLRVLQAQDQTERISIHALREEGDPVPEMPCSLSARFLSTPSARRATHRGRDRVHAPYISIHALREEGDCGDCGKATTLK